MNIFQIVMAWLFGNKKPETTVPAQPRPDIQIVAPVINTAGQRPYMSAAMVMLLGLIREGEAGRVGYNADFSNNSHFGNLSLRTFDQVRAMSYSQVKSGEPSSAIGGYQFLYRTLDSLKTSLHLTGSEKFDPRLQDDLAVALMVRRGLLEYLAGSLSLAGFCNNLAKEWASLPVVTSIRGAHRQLKPGQSYYAGDGLNHAYHPVETITNAIRAVRSASK